MIEDEPSGKANRPRVLVYAYFWQYNTCVGAAPVQDSDCYWCRYLCASKYIASANAEYNCGYSNRVRSPDIGYHNDSPYDLCDNANYFQATQTLVVKEEIILM